MVVRIKTECISFPFLPIYKYHDELSDDNTPVSRRVLGVPNSENLIVDHEKYFSFVNYYQPSGKTPTFTNGINLNNHIGYQDEHRAAEDKLLTFFEGDSWYSLNSTGTRLGISNLTESSDINSIISNNFDQLNNILSLFKRNRFPHSILKHTLYAAKQCGDTYQIIDSLEYIIDLTRGRMAFYPFTNATFAPSLADQHDVQVVFEAMTENSYGKPISQDYTSEHSGSTYNNFNYFPEENVNFTFNPCSGSNNYIPSSYPSGTYNNDFVRLPQFSTTGVILCDYMAYTRAGYEKNAGKSIYKGDNSSINKHTYKIDQPFDIRVINPSEKIVYNPSEVQIDLENTNNSGTRTLTFPSGYTFKTVLRNYPSKEDVEDAITDQQLNDYYGKTPFDIPVPQNANTGIDRSKYIVMDGTTLNIEDCVSIWDAEIEVQSGGTVNYSSNKVYGNYTINKLTGGVVNNTTSTGSCLQDCLQTDITSSDWNNHTIETDQTIPANTTIRVFGTLTIDPTITLTLDEGCKLEFAPNSRLIIETNGFLAAYGTVTNPVKLTSMCENMWEGIELRTASAHLTHTIIENALIGIKDYSTIDKNVVSGHFESNHAIFRNCITGLHLKSPLGTLSTYSLSNCTFETTNALPDVRFSIQNNNKPSIIHILDERTHGYFYWGCTFQNRNTKLRPHEKGIGIKSVKGAFNIGAYASVTNTFSNLSVGVLAINSNSMKPSLIDNAEFYDNIYGVILLNRSNTTISNCQFEVQNSPSNISSSLQTSLDLFNRPTGIYAKNSSGFYIHDNLFTEGSAVMQTTNANCDNCNQSIVVDGTSSKQGNGLIMNNIFEKINMGVMAQNGNGVYSGDHPVEYIDGEGVTIVCNSFTDLTTWDIVLPQFGPGGFHGYYAPIRDQGYCRNDPDLEDHPALNSFNNCVNITRNIHNEVIGNGFVTYYHADEKEPGCHQLIEMWNCDIYDIEDPDIDIDATCAKYYDNFAPVIQADNKRSQYASKNNELIQLRSNFTSLLDGGNSVYLIDLIQNGSFYTALAAAEDVGSYLSNEVLIASIYRFGNTETQRLIDILQNNSNLQETVWDVVLQHDITYGRGLTESLTPYQEGVSPRESFIKWIDYTAYERNTILDGLVTSDYLENDNLELTISELYEDSNPFIQRKLLKLLISEYRFDEAHSLIETLRTIEDTSIYILEQEAQLLILENDLSFYQLPSNLISQLQRLWERYPQETSWSSLMAKEHGWQYFISPSLLSTSTENNKWDGQTQQKEQIIQQSFFNCYPNPTSKGGFIQGKIIEEIEFPYQLIIYNALGQMVKRWTINQSQFVLEVELPASGLYLVTLVNNEIILNQQKWVVH